MRLTEGPGHAHELACAAVAARAAVVCAWGGDGTVNEIARALAGSGAALGVVPAGSGNGLARELGVPWDPAAALAVALGRRERVIDVGDIEGRLFVNLAGIGLDAHIAALFNARGGRRRGFLPYLAIGTREILHYRAREYTIRGGVRDLAGAGPRHRVRERASVRGRRRGRSHRAARRRAARSRDGGDTAPAAGPARRPSSVPGHARPGARRDDQADAGRGDLGAGPIPFHVDGEAVTGGPVLTVRIRPAVLRVRVP